MNIAFTRIGGKHWIGGQNYLVNLLAVLSEYQPECRCIVFLGVGTDSDLIARIECLDNVQIVLSPKFGGNLLYKTLRRLTSFFLQRDFVAEHEFSEYQIDVVFQHQAWYGLFFPIPTVAWIADFQHCRLPAMFSPFKRSWRSVGYHALGKSASLIMVSSQDALRDCTEFFPGTRGKVLAVPFAIRQPSLNVESGNSASLLEKYSIPERYFYLPNQFWKHKNHMLVVSALQTLVHDLPEIVIVVSGLLEDNRHPTYPASVIDAVKNLGLERNFLYVGKIAHSDVLQLMKNALATLNPSMFEGWSTTVEEAKSLSCKLLLSDIPIHREQAEKFGAEFFAVDDPADLGRKLRSLWHSGPQESLAPDVVGPSPSVDYQCMRSAFASDFIKACHAAVAANGARIIE